MKGITMLALVLTAVLCLVLGALAAANVYSEIVQSKDDEITGLKIELRKAQSKINR